MSLESPECYIIHSHMHAAFMDDSFRPRVIRNALFIEMANVCSAVWYIHLILVSWWDLHTSTCGALVCVNALLFDCSGIAAAPNCISFIITEALHRADNVSANFLNFKLKCLQGNPRLRRIFTRKRTKPFSASLKKQWCSPQIESSHILWVQWHSTGPLLRLTELTSLWHQTKVGS